MHYGFELTVIICMIGLNAVFAAYEMALASISRARLSALAARGVKGAKAAFFMKNRMEASLAVVQLGITLAGAIAAATGGAGVEESFAPYFQRNFGLSERAAEVLAIACLVIPLSSFTIVFAELIPKMFALNNREWVCLKLSLIMKWVSFIAYPIVSVFETIVKRAVGFSSALIKSKVEPENYAGIHELKAAATLARASLLIGATEEQIVLSAAELSFRPVASIMLPASEIATIAIDATLSDALIRAHLDMHTRFPVCEKEDDPQTIKGYVIFKDIVSALKTSPGNPTIEGIMRPIKIFDSQTSLSNVLTEMIREEVHIAVISSKGKGIVGMITLEDIVEELVGKIQDEYDRLPSHIHPIGPSWIVGGGVPISSIASELNITLPDQKLGGKTPCFADWLTHRLGRNPSPGEILQIDSLQVTVRKLRRSKLYEGIIALS